MKPEFMTIEELSEYLRLSVHTLYKMAQQGRIPALKAGAAWRFKKEEIDEWMKAGAKRSSKPGENRSQTEKKKN